MTNLHLGYAPHVLALLVLSAAIACGGSNSTSSAATPVQVEGQQAAEQTPPSPLVQPKGDPTDDDIDAVSDPELVAPPAPQPMAGDDDSGDDDDDDDYDDGDDDDDDDYYDDDDDDDEDDDDDDDW